MIRLKILITFSIIFTFSSMLVFGQKSVKELLTHKIIVNFDDSTIVSYVKPVKGVPVETDRQYFWFSSNKISHTQGGYSGKLLNGDYNVFYANKNLKELGYFYKGLKSGVWKRWNENGNLQNDYTWNFGKKNGIYHKYDSLGKATETGKYRNDLLNGKQVVLAGDSTRIVHYKKGKTFVPKSIVPGFIRRIFK